LWQHYSSWRDPSLRQSEEEPLAELVAVPLLVRELALWQLKSLQEAASPDSSASAVAEGAAEESSVDPDDDGDARP